MIFYMPLFPVGFLNRKFILYDFLYAFISRGVPQRNKAGLGFGPQKKGASTEAPL
jgi:hypothetical protein